MNKQQVAKHEFDMAVNAGDEFLANVEQCLENMLKEVQQRREMYRTCTVEMTRSQYNHEKVLGDTVGYLVQYPCNFRLDLVSSRVADLAVARKECSK
jgi:hypothetical protein